MFLHKFSINPQVLKNHKISSTGNSTVPHGQKKRQTDRRADRYEDTDNSFGKYAKSAVNRTET